MEIRRKDHTTYHHDSTESEGTGEVEDDLQVSGIGFHSFIHGMVHQHKEKGESSCDTGRNIMTVFTDTNNQFKYVCSCYSTCL